MNILNNSHICQEENKKNLYHFNWGSINQGVLCNTKRYFRVKSDSFIVALLNLLRSSRPLVSYKSLQTMADEVGISRNHMRVLIRAMEADGLISVCHRYYQTNVYYLSKVFSIPCVRNSLIGHAKRCLSEYHALLKENIVNFCFKVLRLPVRGTGRKSTIRRGKVFATNRKPRPPNKKSVGIERGKFTERLVEKARKKHPEWSMIGMNAHVLACIL